MVQPAVEHLAQLIFRQLFVDFFSTIVFLVVYAATGDIIIATAVAIAGAIAIIAAIFRGQDRVAVAA